MSKLPPTLSPFATSHPASSAYRINLSPHEWEWTQDEQEAIARALVELDGLRQHYEARMAEKNKEIARLKHRLLDPDGVLPEPPKP